MSKPLSQVHYSSARTESGSDGKFTNQAFVLSVIGALPFAAFYSYIKFVSGGSAGWDVVILSGLCLQFSLWVSAAAGMTCFFVAMSCRRRCVLAYVGFVMSSSTVAVILLRFR